MSEVCPRWYGRGCARVGMVKVGRAGWWSGGEGAVSSRAAADCVVDWGADCSCRATWPKNRTCIALALEAVGGLAGGRAPTWGWPFWTYCQPRRPRPRCR
eukprot:10934266-Alexandrium_andersonii.AAC.1